MTQIKSIVLQNISYHQGGTSIIRDFNFGFISDKITVIAGRSGSGKSTLLKIINGVLSPSSGTVTLLDQQVAKNDLSIRHKIGYVVQNIGLFPHMTVMENIAISGKITGMLIDHGRTEELLSLVNLPSNFKTKYPHELSGGEQQRVGLCRALYLDPPILLMDEPMSSLDSITRHDLLNQIGQLQKMSARTILYVTHDLRDALRLGDHMIILENGELIQHGSVDDVMSKPLNKIVGDLVAASQI